MGWDVKGSLVDLIVADLIVAERLLGCETQLQAVLLVQHVSAKEMSLVDLGQQLAESGQTWPQCVAGLFPAVKPEVTCTVAIDDTLVVGDPIHVPFEATEKSNPRWEYADWRSYPTPDERLNVLRLHIAEVDEAKGATGLDAYNAPTYLAMLIQCEQRMVKSSVAALVPLAEALSEHDEDITTMEGDGVPVPAKPELSQTSDGEEGVDSAAESGEAEELLPQEDEESDGDEAYPPSAIPPATMEEQEEIAAVLANPKTARPALAATQRFDASNRPLVTDAQLDELYKLGDRIGLNKVELQENVMSKFKVRRIEDLQQSIALQVIKNMRLKASGS